MIDAGINRNPVILPTELSKLAPRREPGSLGHLWKFNRLAQMNGVGNGNVSSQLQQAVNKLAGPQPMVSSGMHPFKIYQLPSQYRTNPQPNDWLKFRCRNGLVTWRPTVVPAIDVGNPFTDWRMTCTPCTYANPKNIDQMGVSTILESEASNTVPFTDKDEVYLQNGGDPDYTLEIPIPFVPSNGNPSTAAYFWINLDQDENGNTSPQIHFGGFWSLNNGNFATHNFGDPIPFEFGPRAFPVTQNIIGNTLVIGSIQINAAESPNKTQGNYKPYIVQNQIGHACMVPSNYNAVAGTYSDNAIYYTGDIVYYPPVSLPASGTPYVASYLQAQNYADEFSNPVDLRGVSAVGISGIAPSGDGTATTAWIPWGVAIAP